MSYIFPTYARWDIEPASADGSYITDVNGKTYIDLTSGIGVCNLGHKPLIVKKAIEEQLAEFWHVSNLFTMGEQEHAAKLLAEAAGLGAVFFANSGAEANEGAIKLARKATGKTKIITFEQSFHGRTFAGMSATGQDKIKSGFGPMLEKFIYVPFNDIHALSSEMDDDVAAVMLEIVQGEGGIHVGNSDFLKAVEKLCEKTRALLIIDEIQTGIGRTGRPFAFQHFDLQPDIVTAAKGLGSGLPIGAVIGKESLKEYFGPGSHGSTFGGNPISIASATATMKIIFDDGFLEEVLIKSEFLLSQISKILTGMEMVKDVRGLGLMVGIEFTHPIHDLLAELRSEGLLALPAGENVIRLLPPLTISVHELEQSMEILNKTIKEMKKAAI